VVFFKFLCGFNKIEEEAFWLMVKQGSASDTVHFSIYSHSWIKEKSGGKACFFPNYFVTLSPKGQDRLHFGNKNKSRFILYFAQFALSLHSE
jgi:hypothetical protein